MRVKPKGRESIYVGRRYGEFAHLHKRLRMELPGRVLPSLPRKIKNSTSSTFLSVGNDDDASSVSSVSTQGTSANEGSMKVLMGHQRARSRQSLNTPSADGRTASPRPPSDADGSPQPNIVQLYREEQRVSLRAFLRTLLQHPQIAESKAVDVFLTGNSIKLNVEELTDIDRRKAMDEKRIEEQKQFYEIARQRARELDVYMEKFRRDVVESSMCSSISPDRSCR